MINSNSKIHIIKEKKKDDIIENFNVGSIHGSYGSDERNPWPKPEKSSITSQYRCSKRNRDEKNPAANWKDDADVSGKIGRERKKKSYLIGPTEDQNHASYSVYNPIWLILPVINLLIEILFDIFSIFTWFFNLIFMETYNMIVPDIMKSFLMGTGITSSRKYCMGLSLFRYFIIILCPPAGVFMAYGFSGWLQILICCIGSLIYYFPGLVYALILVNRSEVADYMKKSQSTDSDCSDSGLLGGIFIGDQDNAPQCAATLGEECTPNGANLVGGNPRKKDCCANPVLGSDGTYTIDGKPAQDHESKIINSAAQGAVICRNDYKKIKMKKGMCVWKATGKP